ncbi:MAG: hypothetical protein AAF708_00655 [Deinococcota bacterium]
MDVFRTNATVDQDGHLRLDIPTNLPAGKVELVIVVNRKQDKHKKSSNYDFSDLIGKLTWQGDALSVQRALREEWSE